VTSNYSSSEFGTTSSHYEEGSAIRVQQSTDLSGTVRVSGAKNSVLKIMAASLLAPGQYVLNNVPHISDVRWMANLLETMGASISHQKDVMRIEIPQEMIPIAPYELVERMRASIVVLGPLLARFGKAKVSVPGGDDFGHRPIDMHLKGLEEMGASFTSSHGYIEGEVKKLVGGKVLLNFPSVGATENLLMAAVLAEGRTVIENAAREPEIADLVNFLNSMGAQIIGEGTSTIQIEGVDNLSPIEHTVIPDRIEAATYMAALGMTGGQIVIEEARLDHMEMLVEKLNEMGMEIDQVDGGVSVCVSKRLRSVDLATLPYPGVATDYKPFMVALLSISDGVGIVTENIFAGRFRYVDELIRMGADIRAEGHHAVVRGVERLSGAPVRAPDIRAGAALVLAGLAAEGETFVGTANHIERGYQNLVGNLNSLGAKIELVNRQNP
jgi:UDP-N-acetylglucosamine 1-carboxyvinyltransferase|tara:strand:- start:5392 stop:6711 length:1320 start_codon:yes stop_codon:yes gene_type:complete